jgi:hypothetical protein
MKYKIICKKGNVLTARGKIQMWQSVAAKTQTNTHGSERKNVI